MAAGIDLPTLAAKFDIPASTLRFWARTKGWQPVGQGRFGAKLYNAADVAPHVIAAVEARQSAAA